MNVDSSPGAIVAVNPVWLLPSMTLKVRETAAPL